VNANEQAPASTPADLPANLRRLVWAAWTVAMLVAALTYAWKAADSRSAFVRWRHQVLEIADGVDIWGRYYFPNPPIVPLMLYPLMVLPPVVGAMIWYGLKVGMVAWCVVALTRMARGPNGPRLPAWALALILLMSFRTILSDLQHGNINILILFLVVAALGFWRRGRDFSAGVTLALAISTKVTPALFLPYLLWKRSWKSVAWCLAATPIFLVVVPSTVLGPAFTLKGLNSWRRNIISPFVEGEVIKSTQEVNQSMVGVFTRLLTESRELAPHSNGGTRFDLNVIAWDREVVARLVKGMALALVGLGAFLCRTKGAGRDDPRLLGEFALVVLTMLFVSERSWKSHYVTIILPLTYLLYRLSTAPLTARGRWVIAGALALSAALMWTTSSEVGGCFFGGQGHEYALYFGMYFWSGVVLYVATAWRVSAERWDSPSVAPDQGAPSLAGPGPHFGSFSRRSDAPV
jgi:hypothetical protein